MDMDSASSLPSRVQWEPRTFSNENGAYIEYSPDDYDALLHEKVERLSSQFRSVGYLPEEVAVETSPSVKENYRSRCRFGITQKDGRRCFVMWEHGMEEEDRVYFMQFPLATREVNRLMLKLLEAIDSSPLLLENLARVNFLCATTGDSVITLLYDEPLLEGWKEAAQELSEKLCCSILARSRQGDQAPNPRFWSLTSTVGKNYVIERYMLSDGRELQYKQPEGSFSNPNASVCIGTLNWLCDVSSGIEGAKEHDFLELYCGNGNHTVALSPYFRMVVGIELDDALVQAANDNLAANGVPNARVVCRASGQYCSEVLRRRKRGYSQTKEERHRRAMLAKAADEAGSTGGPDGASGSCVSDEASVAPRPNRTPHDHYLVAAGCSASGPSGSRVVEAAPEAIKAGTCSVMAKEGLRCNFRTVLVDPPRSGLDAVTLKFLKAHQNVLYISCNPDALQRDLEGLLKTHELERFIVFDHFPYTKHAECGVYLKRRPKRSGNEQQQPQVAL